MTTDFKIRRSWLKSEGPSEVDATFARLQIIVGNHNVTEYSAENSEGGEHLEIPTYYLAEWMAENWWPLLWEPRKNEDIGDDENFLARHSILTAQHGFALPKILIVPFGRNVQISASARHVQFADIRFRNGSYATFPHSFVESELTKFVRETVDRLIKCNITQSPLQEAWSLITETAADEVQFCRFMGALGVSPYVANEIIESTLERLLPLLGERLVLDLCLASSAENFASAARQGEIAHEAMKSASIATLEPLAMIAVPPDNLLVPAWRRGVNAAHRARAKLGIEETDPHGGDKLFELLKIDTSRKIQLAENELDMTPVVGSISRDALDARLALLPSADVQRRFAAGRAAYMMWASDENESRFLTHAVTRNQQASRAFAAEMLAPVRYIRSQARGGKLPQHQLFEIASSLNIGPDVVKKQALNNGLQISAS